jgi:hypothetical protein
VPTVRLTEAAVEGIEAPDPSGRQRLYWDAHLKGFAVLASGISGAKTYIVQMRLPDGRSRRVTIGATNVFGIEKARREAIARLLAFANGRLRASEISLSLDQILSLPQQPMTPRPTGWAKLVGIYFLLLGTDLQYAGQTIDAFRRVWQHQKAGKIPFDGWRLLPTSTDDLGVLEETYIRFHKPPYNVGLRRPKAAPAQRPVLLTVKDNAWRPRRRTRGVQMNLLALIP